MSAELHCYDYVNQPFEIVRRSVLLDPKALFGHATSTRAGKLHVKLGGLDLGAEIEVEVNGVIESREPFERPRTTITLTWRGKRAPAWFPVMAAELAIFPLSPTETQLALSGTYQPPLGLVGDAIDAVAMKKIAQESVDTFVREIASYLRRTLPAAQAYA